MRPLLLLTTLVSLLSALTGGVLAVSNPGLPGDLTLHFLDVGQGDSILITSTTGRRILVDTGPDETVLRKELAAVLPPLQKRIDVVLLTHSDGDHINGARMVLEEFQVRLLIMNNEQEISPAMQEVLAAAERRGVAVAHASPGRDLQIDDGVIIDILTPVEGFVPGAEKPNEHSVVFMLLAPSLRMLFTGDAETGGEQALLASGAALKADWLKGGHHGSKTSTRESFLRAVQPGTVIFQNGKNNSYKHPAQEVMDRLAAAQIPVYNTSTSGRITLRCTPHPPCTLTTEHRDHAPGAH